MSDKESRSLYYVEDIGPRLKPEIVEVYRKWSGIEGNALLERLHKIRERAWDCAPFPCVGSWIFILPSISIFARYQEIVKLARNDTLLLDLGCCFGQDLRLLAADGVSTEHMYASDIHSDLWKLGYELFGDRQRMKAEFIQADVCEANSGLDKLDGKIDIILVCQLLHLWDWKKQLVAMTRIARLSKVGTLVVGYQRGRLEPLSSKQPWGNMYIHSLGTFRQIWQQLGTETNTIWEVDAEIVELGKWEMAPGDTVWMDQPPKGINFIVTRTQ